MFQDTLRQVASETVTLVFNYHTFNNQSRQNTKNNKGNVMSISVKVKMTSKTSFTTKKTHVKHF